jgi:UDP-N-acetylglucosamine 2-epimerase (non-hydrolysing)
MTRELLTDKAAYEKMAKARNPYGDGRASERIADAILYHFRRIPSPPAEFN